MKSQSEFQWHSETVLEKSTKIWWKSVNNSMIVKNNPAQEETTAGAVNLTSSGLQTQPTKHSDVGQKHMFEGRQALQQIDLGKLRKHM